MTAEQPESGRIEKQTCGFSDFSDHQTRSVKRIVCSSVNTFKRSRMYFHYGCGATQARGAARARQAPYKPWLCCSHRRRSNAAAAARKQQQAEQPHDRPPPPQAILRYTR